MRDRGERETKADSTSVATERDTEGQREKEPDAARDMWEDRKGELDDRGRWVQSWWLHRMAMPRVRAATVTLAKKR